MNPPPVNRQAVFETEFFPQNSVSQNLQKVVHRIVTLALETK